MKAVQNRAHLFPVKVLVNGKTKTYYSIRYKTGNKAMEIAKKQMKIPNNAEVLFDTKDGKKKNLTEKEVLKIYDKAGKPGSLQEFIKANFKKPIAKPKNSTTVDIEQQQMSIDDLMQGNNKKNNKETSGKEKTEKLWQEFEKWRVKANNDLSGIVRSYHKDIEDMNASEYKSIMEHFFKEEIARGYTQNGETIDECLENYIQMFKDQIKDKEDRKNAWNDDYYKEIYNHLEKMHEKGDWTFELDAKKYLRQFLRDKVGLDRYAAQNAGKAALKDILAKNDGDKKEEKKKEPESGITITGPVYDDDERPTYYINDNGNVIETQDTKIVDQYRAKQKEVETEKPGTQGNGQDLDALAEQDKALKEQRDKQWAKEMEFKPEHIDEGDYGKIRKFGTKKIESKGEYSKTKDLNDYVNKAKAVKDFHLDIKGRAMLDMFGIEAPLFNKRNGKPISVDRYTKALGYCAQNRNGDTIEIALVAETGDTVGETKTTIHECMHSKLRNGISEAMEGIEFKNYIVGKNIRGYIEETIVEMAGQGVSNLIHGNETDKQRWAYEGIAAQAIPAIWGIPEFKEARKKGLHGIGQEICKNLMNDNREFVQNVVDRYIENPKMSKYIKTPIENKSGDIIEKRMKAIETKVIERTDKVEKIKNDTRRSGIADLVEELKRGTISLEGALNSSQYRELAAILITKFLEDEDLDALEELALSF